MIEKEAQFIKLIRTHLIGGGQNECAEQSLPYPVGDSLKKK